MDKITNNTKACTLPAGTLDLLVWKSSNSLSDRHSPTLSLCMIVKNEERFLPRCLESVKDYVDEIIIVDTGSTDSTVEIAKKYNAKIYHHPWENSFSKARNYSLKYATCDWILWLDADEEIDKEDAYKLKEVIKDDDASIIHFPMFNKPIDGKAVSVFNALKIFRNHLGFHFEGIVHNELKYTGSYKIANIRSYHYGYNLDEDKMDKKFIRTTTLLKERVKNYPEDPIPHHYLAVSYLGKKEHDHCVHEALEAIKLFEHHNDHPEIMILSHYMASVAFYHKNDLDNAETYALKVVDLYPEYLDVYCLLSSIYFKRKDYSRCIQSTSKYIKLLKSIETNPTNALVVPFNTLNHAWLAHLRVAILSFEQGNEHEGRNALKHAIDSANHEWEPYLAIGEYFLLQKDLNLTERFLNEALKRGPSNLKILLNLGRLYYLKNDLGIAEIYYKQVLEIDPGYVEALKGIGTLCLNMKRFEEARVFLYKALQKVKDLEIYNNLGCLEDKECLYERSIYFFNKALEFGPENQIIIGNVKNIQNKLLKERKSEEYSTPKDGSISLCMIVKNEEHNLIRCLSSVKDVVDEIIVVDTGSTDRTVDIARSFGAKVFSHPWEGSFSKARNYSLKYATSEWILYLDADEELSKSDVPMFLNVVKNSNYTTVSFVIKNKFKNSTQESYASMIRLFKNYNGIYYDGIVHNAIKYNGKLFGSSISIIHHGYNLSDDQMEEKFLRTTTLLKKQAKSDEHNPVPHMYLGVSYLGNAMYDEAILESKCALRLVDVGGVPGKEFLVSYYIASAAYFEKGEFGESEKYAQQAISLDGQFVDGFCILSLIHYNLKKYDECLGNSNRYLMLYESIVKNPAKNSTFIYHTMGHKWKIHLIRGFCYLSTGRNENGNIEVSNALKHTTDIEECLDLLGNYYMENNSIDKAEEVYRRLLSENELSINALIKMGYIKYKKGSINDTVHFWRKAVNLGPTLFDIRLLICRINIKTGNFEDVFTDCDMLLHELDIHRNITLDDFSDLATIFSEIGDKFKERNDIQTAQTAFKIYEELEQMQINNSENMLSVK